MKVDFIIAGAGLFGSVFAQQCKEHGKTCHVFDPASDIGGNCHSYNDNGIEVHSYGPHILHTNDEEIWKYIERFTPINEYKHRVVAMANDTPYSFPLNLMTLHQVFPDYDDDLVEWWQDRKKSVTAWLDEQYEDQNNFKCEAIKQVGRAIYELFFEGYTRKHWGRDPLKLPASWARRLPVRMNYDDQYHDSRFSGIPKHGYRQWFANILEGIKVTLGQELNSTNWHHYAPRLVWTGSIDAFFNYCFGKLQYRTCQFVKFRDEESQGVAQVNYCDYEIDHTRSIEYARFDTHKNGKPEKVTLVQEYPGEWEEGMRRMYPVRIPQNEELYRKYKELASKEKDVIFGGRLGSFRYMDMHMVIAQALKAFKDSQA